MTKATAWLLGGIFCLGVSWLLWAATRPGVRPLRESPLQSHTFFHPIQWVVLLAFLGVLLVASALGQFL
jgi:hypothetical protein